MRSQSFAASTDHTTDPFAHAITDRDEELARINAALAALRDEVAADSIQAKGAGHHGLRMALRGVAAEIVRVSRPSRRDTWIGEVLELIKAANDVGARDLPALDEDVALAREYVSRGWTGVLATMLLVPAWQSPNAPSFDAIPDWLWGDYSNWLFKAPLRFAVSSGDAASDLDARRVKDLERWVSRNAGSSSVRAALTSFLQGGGSGYVRHDSAAWRQIAEARGTILTRANVRARADYEPPVAPRHGRRLRVGFVARDFGPHPDVYATLPCFEQIDAKAFDVFLFPLKTSESAEAAYCSRRTRATQVLPEGTETRIAALRSAQLDVVVFVGDLGREWNELTELALFRVAPLQVVNHRSGFSTGLPEIDLYVAGREPSDSFPSTAFTERVGVIRGPAVSIAFAQPEAGAETPGAARDQVGLPADAVLFVSLVDMGGVDQAQLQAWARILSRNERAHLAIAFAQTNEDSKLTRFCAAVDRVLTAQGVASTRATVFPTSTANPHETRALIALADVVIDAGADNLATWSTAEALRAGIPVITCGLPDRQAPAAILASLGLPELVASDLASLETIAGSLAGDTERRTALRTAIANAMESTPEFTDSLAASDAFGALIESAFDELASLGWKEFRKQSDPVRCFSVENPTESIEAGFAAHARSDLDGAAMDANLALRSAPADTRVRHLHGVVLHAQGNASRAVDYLLAAVQRPDATAAMWYALALALRDNRQVKEAIQVLETCIRLDNRNVEALFTLLELAEAAGATEIARDVLECLKEVAPDDPRVLALS